MRGDDAHTAEGVGDELDEAAGGGHPHRDGRRVRFEVLWRTHLHGDHTAQGLCSFCVHHFSFSAASWFGEPAVSGFYVPTSMVRNAILEQTVSFNKKEDGGG